MLAISLHQPYATWVSSGLKPLETRWRKINYRGPIVITSTKKFDSHPSTQKILVEHKLEFWGVSKERARYAQIVGIGVITNCRPMLPGDEKDALIGYDPKRWVWELADVTRAPIDFHWHNTQGFMKIPDSVIEHVFGTEIYKKYKALEAKPKRKQWRDTAKTMAPLNRNVKIKLKSGRVVIARRMKRKRNVFYIQGEVMQQQVNRVTKYKLI